MKRTHHCNQIRTKHIGSEVILNGWVHSRRDLGGVLFIDIRDREGRTQSVFDPSEVSQSLFDKAASLHSESVIAVKGKVRRRPEGTDNVKIATGQIEILVTQMAVINAADALPFPVDDPEIAAKVHEELRLKYRYLDLRRPDLANNLRTRSRVAMATRAFLDREGFWEIDTPMLFKSTPEGAREFLVPSRVHSGKFYALPQSPQQFKQILMVGGVEKYFQIARCFRDEDLRADRQPEFTQIDIEMAFVDREDIYQLVEALMAAIWKTHNSQNDLQTNLQNDFQNVSRNDLQTDFQNDSNSQNDSDFQNDSNVRNDFQIELPFLRLTFEEALNRFGTDKPDTRWGMELVDLTEAFRASAFKVFRSSIEKGGVLKAINAKGFADASQGEIEAMTGLAKGLGAKGLAFIKVENGEWKSPIVKFFDDSEKAALREKLQIEEGDCILFAAGQWRNACEILGAIRLYCAGILKRRGRISVDANRFDFLWVTDFPLLSFDEEMNRWYSSHHPFTAPVEEDIPFLIEDPKRVRGQHYDLVVNGVELGGGSIRIHQAELQRMVFEKVLKLPEEVVEQRFGYLLESFRFGAPPHGGIALGFDRLIALLTHSQSIREVIAFPKTAKANDLLTQSPAPVETQQLRTLHLQIKNQKR